jgi:hypothetical protein
MVLLYYTNGDKSRSAVTFFYGATRKLDLPLFQPYSLSCRGEY